MPRRILAFGVLLIAVADTNAQQSKKPSHDYGLTDSFNAKVKEIGQISPDDFARKFDPNLNYLAKPSADPTAAKFWNLFTLDPAGPGVPPVKDPMRYGQNVDMKKFGHLYDFRLNDQELGVFKKNGFVVSERLGSHSFTDFYYRLYVRDLPVFITSDSMLHAWHRFFDRMLESLEDHYFRVEFDQMLNKMAREIPAAKAEYGAGPLADALTDVDFFLTTARRLLGDKDAASALGQGKRVNEAMAACHALGMEKFVLFGRERTIDFSQFKPRGRYEETLKSQDYFRGVMWLGRIDFRIAGSESPEQDRRELAGAIVLSDLLKRAGMVERWQGVDRVLLNTFGKSDSLNFSQLGVVLGEEAITAKSATAEKIEALRQRILQSKIGEQHIRGEWFVVDINDPKTFVLPRSFTFMGQRFALDSWALSKIVYDDIHWTGANGKDEKVQRRIPSSLDMSFAVFGNDQLTPILAGRMKNQAGRKFRDGENYQHNLAAVRTLVKEMPAATLKESIYADWLGCLRELSTPTVDAKYPDTMRTREWALKSTATQLASWTQLRHDSVLYVKPSYTAGNACEYPAGFVEPVPHFWRRFHEMAARTKSLVAATSFPDEYAKGQGQHLRDHYVQSIDKFVKASKTLLEISDKEIAQEPLTEDQVKFLKQTVVRGGGSGMPPISGWYPNLFTRRSQHAADDDAHKWVAVVTDVHTDAPSDPVGDPGCVLHQGVGNVDAMILVVDSGKDRMIYAGPVFSHYEFDAPIPTRHTNSEWHTMIREGKQPPRPEWTSGYVVPGRNPDVKDYGKVDKRWKGE